VLYIKTGGHLGQIALTENALQNRVAASDSGGGPLGQI
jgi:hypothetical protein